MVYFYVVCITIPQGNQTTINTSWRAVIASVCTT